MARGRSWMVTIHEKNMKNAGLSDNDIANPKTVAEFFKDRWEKSGTGRKACVATCRSKEGLYHLHAYLYGNTTTETAVASCMYDSHVELVIDKNALSNYIQKRERYAEKGEEVLYIAGEENIKSEQGRRNDLEYMQSLIDKGASVEEIKALGLKYCRYTNMLNDYSQVKQRKDAPLKKQMHREWHVGSVDSGINIIIDNLCYKYGKDKVFIIQNLDFGCFDLYNQQGSPPVIVLEDLDDSIKLNDLLAILGEYTNTTVHARYQNVIPLWTEVHIISTLAPERYCKLVRGANGYERLMSKLDYITYHYDENGQKKNYSCQAKRYQNYERLKQNAKSNIFFRNNNKSIK